MAIGPSVHRFSSAEYDALMEAEHAAPGPDGHASVVTLRGDDVLDAHVEGVPTTTVAAILPH